MNIHLQLPTETQQNLKSLANQFYKELENHLAPFPRAATLSQLKNALKEALLDQEDFDSILTKAKVQAQLLTLIHKDTAIRNLPWQIATEQYPLLTIAKAWQQDLEAHQPSLGYPLKVLVMVAAPEGVTRLDYEKEELQLLQAFSPLMSQGLAEVHFTEDGSLENLEEKLEENRYHILHFSGHGVFHQGQGYLALEDPITGKQQLTKAEDFNAVLARVAEKGYRPDLVLLSACQTAQGVEAGDLAGVADTLLAGGLSAVIAMSASILDNCATLFAAKLYEELATEYPLPAAFRKARLAVRDFEIATYKPAEYGLAPGQWIIPQLLVNKTVGELVDKSLPKTTLDFKKDVQIITGQQALVDLRVRPKGYLFVGRRKEKRIALRQLKDGNSILLRGQGGVGKTALAEHLAIRLLAANPRTKIFTFSEKTPAAQSLLDQLKTYLTKEKKDFSVISELARIDKLTDQFLHLLGKVSQHCEPVFLFDNMESFQIYDKEQARWGWNQDQHEDVWTVLQLLHAHSPFPMIITGRYRIAELPKLEICNLNTAPFGDFFKKCYQMEFRRLSKSLGTEVDSNLKKTEDQKPLSFEDIARLLHQTFGGNYRALEFFDELYLQKGEAIFTTLEQLAQLQEKVDDRDIKEGILARMGKNLIFEELLSYLNDTDLDTLLVLARFNIPILPMAVGMQRQSEDRTDSLHKLSELTLIERQQDQHNRDRFYVIPLVQDLLADTKGQVPFNPGLAGDYHDYMASQELSEDPLGEYSEAFECYFQASAVAQLNTVGDRLCNYYYDIQQFRLALTFGIRTEAIAGVNTDDRIYSNLGIIFQIFGQLEAALHYQKKSLEADQKKGDRQGEGTTLNNISQIHKVRGDYGRALDYLERSLKIQQEIGDRQGEGTTLNNISQIHKVRGDYGRALDYLERSLKIQQEIGDRKGEGTTAHNIGAMLYEQKKPEEAIPYLMRAYGILEQIGSPNVKAPESYLNAIIQQIGEERFKAILNNQNQ